MSHKFFWELQEKNPNTLGVIFSPTYYAKPKNCIYALDNGCFQKFEPEKFMKMLLKNRNVAEYHPPLFITCPDVLMNCEMTLVYWYTYSKLLKPFGRMAFVAQDGMEPQDCPSDAEVIFIGGSTKFKLENAHRFRSVAKHLHIGRVSTEHRWEWAKNECKADSCDGSKICFAGENGVQFKQLKLFLENKKARIF